MVKWRRGRGGAGAGASSWPSNGPCFTATWLNTLRFGIGQDRWWLVQPVWPDGWWLFRLSAGRCIDDTGTSPSITWKILFFSRLIRSNFSFKEAGVYWSPDAGDIARFLRYETTASGLCLTGKLCFRPLYKSMFSTGCGDLGVSIDISLWLLTPCIVMNRSRRCNN